MATGEDFRILVVPDHRTPVRIRTHSSDPVPFVIFSSKNQGYVNESNRFDEVSGGGRSREAVPIVPGPAEMSRGWTNRQ